MCFRLGSVGQVSAALSSFVSRCLPLSPETELKDFRRNGRQPRFRVVGGAACRAEGRGRGPCRLVARGEQRRGHATAAPASGKAFMAFSAVRGTSLASLIKLMGTSLLQITTAPQYPPTLGGGAAPPGGGRVEGQGDRQRASPRQRQRRFPCVWCAHVASCACRADGCREMVWLGHKSLSPHLSLYLGSHACWAGCCHEMVWLGSLFAFSTVSFLTGLLGWMLYKMVLFGQMVWMSQDGLARRPLRLCALSLSCALRSLPSPALRVRSLPLARAAGSLPFPRAPHAPIPVRFVHVNFLTRLLG